MIGIKRGNFKQEAYNDDMDISRPLIEYLQHFPVSSESKDHVKRYAYTDVVVIERNL